MNSLTLDFEVHNVLKTFDNVICQNCNRPLEVLLTTSGELSIKPCESCFDEEKEQQYQYGYSDGSSDGHSAGYAEGYEAGYEENAAK